MPLFEFICKKCNENFEKLVFSGEIVNCPKCGSIKIVKQFSRFVTGISSPKCCDIIDSQQKILEQEHKCCKNCRH